MCILYAHYSTFKGSKQQQLKLLQETETAKKVKADDHLMTSSSILVFNQSQTPDVSQLQISKLMGLT